MRTLLLSLVPLVLADVLPYEPKALSPDELAEAVAQACGPVYSKQKVAFTFVVTVDGEEKARRRHDWSPSGDTLRVSYEGVDVAFTHLNPPTAPSATPEARDEAWSAFINDSYWLLAACKANDQGVKHASSDSTHLELRFDGVGLTPGDAYTMTLDPNQQVTRWDYVLQGGTTGAWTWEEYTFVGGLSLSLTRRHVDGHKVIRFEEVEVR